MTIAAASLSERPLSDQKRANGATAIPTSRMIIPKPDAKLTPEPR